MSANAQISTTGGKTGSAARQERNVDAPETSAVALPAVAPPAVTPLPRMQVGILAGTNFINSIAYMITLPIAPFIVLSFFPGLSETEIGFKSGALEGMFHVGSFFGAGFWGWAADRYGRKPSLLVGLGGTAVLSVLFGLASSYPTALLVKFMWGLINGNVGVAKTVLSELSDDTNAPRAFSFIGVATGFGRLVGPAIGGLLAQPAVKYPGTFAADGLFGRHPFLLPCLVCGIITAVCFILGAVYLEETGPQGQKKAGSGTLAAGSVGVAKKAATASAGDVEAGVAEGDDADGGIELVAAQLESRAEPTSSAAGGKETGTVQPGRGRRARGGSAAVKAAGAVAAADSLGAAAVPDGATAVELASPSGTPSGTASASAAAQSDNTADGEAAGGAAGGAAAVSASGGAGRAGARAGSTASAVVSKPASAAGSASSTGSSHGAIAFAGAAGTAADDDDGYSEKPALLGNDASARQRGCCGMRCGYWYTLRRLMADRAVASTVAVYSGLSVIGLVATEVFPLYVLNDAEHGGFSWGSSDVGLLVSICGPCLLLWNLLIYHRVTKRLGLVRMARWCIATNAVLMFATPLCSLALKARSPPTPEQLSEIAQADAAAAAAAAAGDGAAAAAAAAAANAAVTKTALEWVVLSLVFIGATLSRVSAFTCIFVFISNSALPADRSSANAIGQAVASLARAIGPPIATSVFATSVSDANTAAGWPWNYYLCWYVIGATTFAVFGLTFTMPTWIAKKREADASEPPSAEATKLTKPPGGLKEGK